MGRLRRVDRLGLLKPVSRGVSIRGSERALETHSSMISSPSDEAGSMGHAEPPHIESGSQAGSNEMVSGRPHSSPYDHRENAYNELLSWLEADNFQYGIGFPHRFGQ